MRASVATAADPTAVTLAIKDPAGAKTAPSPVKDSVGNYHYDYTPTLPGQYGYAFAGTGAGMLMNKVNMSYIPISKAVPGLPQGIDLVFARAFQADPDQRFQTADDFQRALMEVRW